MPIHQKRVYPDQNIPPGVFYMDFKPYEGPTAKKPRKAALKAKPLTLEVRAEQQRRYKEAQKKREEENGRIQEELAASRVHDEAARVNSVLRKITEAGFPTLHSFLISLATVPDQQIASRVNKMLGHHYNEYLDLILHKQPDRTQAWVTSTMQQVLLEEGSKLLNNLLPKSGTTISTTLAEFSISTILNDATALAPNLVAILSALIKLDEDSPGRRPKDVVLATLLCTITQTRSERASRFQSVLCLYLMACGATVSLFEVLNHAGISLSYDSAIKKLKALSAQELELARAAVRNGTCLLVWDNVNMAFRVAEQRQDSKDHFDNGTTSTLVEAFNIPRGSLPLDSVPPRLTRRVTYAINPQNDLLPSVEQVMELEASMIHHLEEIILDTFPELRQKLKDCPELVPPTVKAIPVHQTIQHSLPAAPIDESTLDGTTDFFKHVKECLQLTEDDIRSHGVFFAHGDQLSYALADSVSAGRRDDTELADNFSRYLIPQLGLFHVRIAGIRCFANEFWGVANSRAPWSLWKVNTMLGRKAVSAGWKAKQLPPHHTMSELMLDLTLPANALDGYRIYCGHSSLKVWVSSIKSHSELRQVTNQVFRNLCSAKRVSELRKRAERDVPLENIILFKRDALILKTMKAAVKRGDIGTVVNVLTYWMVMFRGTGRMPKYADALFQSLMELKKMKPDLREGALNNWLINLSGRPNGFKELDLLQEHHNFWLKVIYGSKGSNRTWKWLAMVSVAIFALRDVIRQVQLNFKTPYNGKSHTRPSAAADIKTLRNYLQSATIQTYTPAREGNESAVPARDLFEAGMAYTHSANAFKTFKKDKRQPRFEAVPGRTPSTLINSDVESEDEEVENEGEDDAEMGEVDVADLEQDEDEYPAGVDPQEMLRVVNEVIGSL